MERLGSKGRLAGSIRSMQGCLRAVREGVRGESKSMAVVSRYRYSQMTGH